MRNSSYVMDGEYYNRLVAAGKRFEYLQKTLADFRLHGDNLSHRHLGAKEIDGELAKQLQLAESRSIRRSYGPKLTSDEHFNSVVDASVICVSLRRIVKS